MTDTPNLSLPLIAAAQAQKHVTHNEALRVLDALVQLTVIDVDRTVPPPAPAEGDRHVVAAGAAGAWAGHDHAVALHEDAAWRFLAPRPGWRAYSLADGALLMWTGAAWSAALGEALAKLGINGAVADAGNRLAVRSEAVSFHAVAAADGGTGDLRLQLSKEAAGDTASALFATGFVGRAEFGLVGGDVFRLKVSTDGAVWRDALAVDHASGQVAFPAGIAGARERLAANRTYYVRSDGANGNDGLSDTAGGAFATIQKAIDVVYGTLDLGGFAVTIQVGPGTHTTPVSVASPQVGAGTVTLQGDAATPANVTIATSWSNAVSVAGAGSKLAVKGFRLQTTNSGAGLSATSGGLITVTGAMEYGACVGPHMLAATYGQISALAAGAYTVSGGAQMHWYANGGTISLYANAVTLVGTPAFTAAFAYAANLGVVGMSSMTFTGAATGARYGVFNNSVVQTYGGPTLPGNAAGTTGSGGQYL